MIFDGLGFLRHNIKSKNSGREMDGGVSFIKVKGLHLSRYRKKASERAGQAGCPEGRNSCQAVMRTRARIPVPK